MNEFRTSEEEQAFEDEASKQSTGDRKQDVLDIWFAARKFFSKPSVAEPGVHVFELSSEEEWPAYLAWSRSVLPDVDPLKAVRLGDIVVARNGKFELYVPSWSSDGKNELAESSAVEERAAWQRLEVLKTVATMPRWSSDSGESTIELAKKYNDWVTGGQSS